MLIRALLYVCIAGLGGCARFVETRITSAGTIGVEKNGYVLAPLDSASLPELNIARDRVAARLGEKGFKPSDTGAYYLEVGVSARPAEIAVLEGKQPMASAMLKRSSKKCPEHEYRVAVALTRIAGGAEMYRGTSGEFHCKKDLASTLPKLVDHALADFGNPRGAYVVKTKVK